MRKRLLVFALVIVSVLNSFSQAKAQSFDGKIEIDDSEFDHSLDESFGNGVYNAKLNRMEYVVETPFYEIMALSNSGSIRILRTVYAYSSQDSQNHKVEIIYVKSQGNEKWEETIRSYLESHSFDKIYTSDYYRSGDYGYYPFYYVCSKCKHRKEGGVEKVYIGPGGGMPLPNNYNKPAPISHNKNAK
ncbi:MAG: hypothetical protein SOZ40_06995 [Ezakiella sp.]|nr:hypothetical protein [Ezakiella sp.]